MAPLNPAKTGLRGSSVDFIHSTDTLEHIPQQHILPILRECFRLLKPGGVISCMIDVQDHYAYFDKNLSPFNFYKYSPLAWKVFFNNRLQYQNRLRPDDYAALFKHAGFDVINIETEVAANRAKAKDVKIHPHFKYYSLPQLNITRCLVVAKKDLK
jgi:SAM-dependent methyltransferase